MFRTLLAMHNDYKLNGVSAQFVDKTASSKKLRPSSLSSSPHQHFAKGIASSLAFWPNTVSPSNDDKEGCARLANEGGLPFIEVKNDEHALGHSPQPHKATTNVCMCFC